MKLGRGISLGLKNFFLPEQVPKKGGAWPGLVNLKAPVEGESVPRAPFRLSLKIGP